MQHFDTTLTSRYECKYLIDVPRAHAIRDYMESHMDLDPFSAKSEGHRYRVQSLYFDTPGLQLYRDTVQGTRNRYKIRFRYYGDEGKGPIFLEVKKRSNIIVRKCRERVEVEEALELLRTGQFPFNGSHGDDLHEFLGRCAESGARPALRIRYWREAWESRATDPVRITFDTEVEHCQLCDHGLVESFPDWRRTPFGTPVILEVKFTDHRPQWLNQMLHRFQLDKISVAKYAESVDHIANTGERDVLEARIRMSSAWARRPKRN